MRFTLAILFTLVLAVPALAATPVEAPDADPLATSAEEAPAPEGEITLEDLENLLTPEAEERSTCTAKVYCGGGQTITCTGTRSCWEEPRCFVLCDGYATFCNSPCP